MPAAFPIYTDPPEPTRPAEGLGIQLPKDVGIYLSEGLSEDEDLSKALSAQLHEYLNRELSEDSPYQPPMLEAMIFDREVLHLTTMNEYNDILCGDEHKLILLSRNLSRSSHTIYMGILCLQPYSL